MATSDPPLVTKDVSLWSELAGVAMAQRYVDAGDVRTRIIEAGDPALPHVVLLHGTGGHLEAFLRNLRGLSSDFHVVAVDMVGHGWSGAPDLPYTLDVYSSHLEAVLDALGIDHCAVVGESLGAWVAAWYVAHGGRRVTRTILTVPGSIKTKPETIERLREGTRTALLEASHATVRARLERLFAPANRHLVSDELVDVRLAIDTRPNAAAIVERVLALQDPAVRRQFAWSPEWCERIDVPTFVLWTDQDPTGTVEEGELLHNWIPGSEFHVIDNAGHWPQWERPEEFNRLTREFLLR